MNTCKLIAFDMDGTLLCSDKTLSEENRLALTAAAEAGIVLVPATGRPRKGITEEILGLPGVRYLILTNGAAVIDLAEQRLLYRRELPVERAVAVMERLEATGLNLVYDCYIDGRGFITASMRERLSDFLKEPAMLRLYTGIRQGVNELKAFLRDRGGTIEKMQSLFLSQEDLRTAQAMLEREFPDLVLSSSIGCNIEINAPGATKGEALLALCRELQIDRQDTAAFGDGINDISLLRAAGLGVAMQNAEDAVKAAADCVTLTNDESGVAKVIRELLAGDEKTQFALEKPSGKC